MLQNVPDTGADQFDFAPLLIAAMADCLPDLDALTTLVEGGDTIRMLLNTRRNAAELIRRARRWGWITPEKAFRSVAKTVSNLWLEWRYGWQQLGYDILNTYEAVTKPVRPDIIQGRAGSSTTDTTEWSQSTLLTRATEELSRTVVNDVSFRANAVGRLDVKTLNFVANPLITAWEVIPFSFVADWFVNVGDVLAAWQVMMTVAELELSKSFKQTVSVESRAGYGPGKDTVTTRIADPGNSVGYETLTKRTRIPAEIPTIVPSITVRLNSKRILDAAALLTTRIF
jgi:hypothetical protein